MYLDPQHWLVPVQKTITIELNKIITRAVDRHFFLADLDFAVFLNADPEPAASLCGSQSSFKKIT